jgi:hypothetical protein
VRSFFAKLRARGAVVVVAWLGLTVANVATFADLRGAIDTDEIYWIGSTYYYHLAFEARDWRHPDWALIPARENPPGAKYVLGLGVAAQGSRIESIDLLATFYAYYKLNLGRHPAFPERAAKEDSVIARMAPDIRRLVTESRSMFIGPELLHAGRRVVLVCGAVTSLLVLLLGASIAGAPTGLLASQLFLMHPAVIGSYRYAMADAPAFMFGVAAALATWLLARRFLPDASPAARMPVPVLSELGLAAIAGVLIGLAVATKLNWVVVAFLFCGAMASLALQAWRRGDRRRAATALATAPVVLVVSLTVFVAINPAIVFDPMHELLTPVRELALAARVQAAVLPTPPHLSTVTAKLAAVTSLVFWTPWTFGLALIAVAFACVRVPRPGIRFLVLWWGIAMVAVTAWIPFEWPRYVLPVVIPSLLLTSHALIVAGTALTRRSS